jgi:hypothetical protein
LAGNSFFILFIIESGTLYVKEILIKKMQGVGDPRFPFTAICCLISIDRPLPLSYIQRERSTKSSALWTMRGVSFSSNRTMDL